MIETSGSVLQLQINYALSSVLILHKCTKGYRLSVRLEDITDAQASCKIIAVLSTAPNLGVTLYAKEANSLLNLDKLLRHKKR